MKTLLIVQSHKEAKPLLDALWPHYKLPGFDILGVTPEDSIHSWPPDIKCCATIGKSGYMSQGLILRWVATWDYVLKREEFGDYTDFCMIEYDSMFLRHPPSHPGGLFTHLAGGPVGSPSKATKFYHCVWWPDRETAQIIVDEGNKLIAQNEWELCSPDLFLGLITDRRPEIKVTETHTWSCNGNDLQNRWPEAEAVVRDPRCFYAHGIRSVQEAERLRSFK